MRLGGRIAVEVACCAGALVLGSCNAQLVDTYDACALQGDLSSPSAFPGDTVSIAGGPFTTTWDTLVQVDGALAQVTDVTFEGDTCTDCADCRDLATTCGECADRCEGCVSSVVFVVPAVGAGSTDVVLTNSYGSTGSLPFEVLGATDTGPVTPPTGTGAGTGTAASGTGGSGSPTVGTAASGTGGTGAASTADSGGSGN